MPASSAYLALRAEHVQLDMFAAPPLPGAADAQHTVQLHDLPAIVQERIIEESLVRIVDAQPDPEWTEDVVVQLHWLLLKDLESLQDPTTPLEKKIHSLDWALTDPALDDRPFSFASCVRVVGSSPLSPTPYFGKVNLDEIRDWLRLNATKWIKETVALYPPWVQELIRLNPRWIASELDRDPQWLNKEIRKLEKSGNTGFFHPVGLCAAN